ncbi:hypothetical protein H2199_007789 [Coniosporium tulheliwenetii]|uniref:Uncharacterized protein n=1 Tax=Coniosporium tulheliwenetii TaxID=3383036 RepID=A0ACC2YP38_9PEZI|nr:hypothetical protein H2199_007789 [Cladosporium sp. JES 115]
MLQEKLESKLDLHTLRQDNQDEGAIDMQGVRNGDKVSQIRLSMSCESPPIELPTKLYILVTSGYVLQYAGEGPSDRLPEKILQLGKDSAAFASDLIPGRHWVLQISQAANEDGTATANHSRSLLARLRFGNQTVRRAVTSFLLVMEGPEEMESWLTVVRQQIELLGGMKCNSEPGSRPPTSDSKGPKLQEKPSHRYLVHRDPNRMDKDKPLVPLPVDSSTAVAGPDWNGNTARFSAIVSDETSLSSRHASVRQSTDAPSVSTTTVSNEQLAQTDEGLSNLCQPPTSILPSL